VILDRRLVAGAVPFVPSRQTFFRAVSHQRRQQAINIKDVLSHGQWTRDITSALSSSL